MGAGEEASRGLSGGGRLTEMSQLASGILGHSHLCLHFWIYAGSTSSPISLSTGHLRTEASLRRSVCSVRCARFVVYTRVSQRLESLVLDSAPADYLLCRAENSIPLGVWMCSLAHIYIKASPDLNMAALLPKTLRGCPLPSIHPGQMIAVPLAPNLPHLISSSIKP